MQITSAQIVRFIEGVAAVVHEQRDYLTQLDAAIGDADHGSNLDRGFSAVLANLPAVAEQDIGAILRMVSLTLISKVGGASGPLYGTAFLRAATTVGDRRAIGPELVVRALEAALEGIQTRGRAQRGEKTMLDTLGPALDALRAALATGDELPEALRKAAAAAEQGMLATRAMLATKGRASYLGERSIGHQDPGATSAYLMVRVLLEVVEAVE